jgi:hypothetical protein
MGRRFDYWLVSGAGLGDGLGDGLGVTDGEAVGLGVGVSDGLGEADGTGSMVGVGVSVGALTCARRKREKMMATTITTLAMTASAMLSI